MTAVVKDIRGRLLAELRNAEYRLGVRHEHARDGVDDEHEVAVVGEQRELSAQTRALLTHRQALLSAALGRLQDGTYGVCLGCGGPIPPARLLSIPEAERCMPCQHRHEREAAAEPEYVGIRREVRPTTKPLEELG